MTKYIKQERARYWPVSKELMAQFRDGSHTKKNDGTLIWMQNGVRHRDGDLPACIGRDGRLEWWKNGKMHRDGDKPAYIGDTLVWYQNGQLHRFGGPARIWANDTCEWWINGREITQEVRTWLNRKRWKGTPEQIVEFKLRFT